MSFFSNMARSWRKSKRLRELQLKIAPPNETVADMAASLRARLERGDDSKDRALEQFLDLCETDEGVINIMNRYRLTRKDLKDRYVSMLAGGLGRWVRGHYAALSTIAYVEPLIYLIESEQRGQSRAETYFQLLQYWEGKIPQGVLARSFQ